MTRATSSGSTEIDALGWLDEADSSYRAAIEEYPVEGDDLGMELRYGLMKVLERKARETKKVEAADEAYKLASSIALKQINYSGWATAEVGDADRAGLADIAQRMDKILDLA